MCSYSQVIEDRCVERGIEKGILIYRTLLETKSIQQTAVKTKEPADKVKKIAEYNVPYKVDTARERDCLKC